MARPLRIEYPGAFYHVMNRGNAGNNIFISDRDKEKFTEYLGVASERFSIVIHTYCLMTNHYHLLIETNQPNLSKAIQWLNVSYATYFNKKRHRTGHLFQGRFKSILVDADEYLKHLSRYIHLNPVRAGIAETPLAYKWSSYPAFIGKAKSPEWLETEWLLLNFGEKKNRQKYKAFVEEVDCNALESPEKNLVGGFILGDNDFVSWVKETFLSDRNENKEIPQLRKLKPRITLDAITRQLCMAYSCNEEAIIKKGWKNNRIRDMAIYLARNLSGLSGKKLGTHFGGISGAAVTLRYNIIAKEMEQDKKLNNELKELKRIILN